MLIEFFIPIVDTIKFCLLAVDGQLTGRGIFLVARAGTPHQWAASEPARSLVLGEEKAPS